MAAASQSLFLAGGPIQLQQWRGMFLGWCSGAILLCTAHISIMIGETAKRLLQEKTCLAITKPCTAKAKRRNTTPEGLESQ